MARSNRVGKLRRMGGPKRDDGRRRRGDERPPRGPDADCAMRVDDEAALAIDACHFHDAACLVDPLGAEVGANALQDRGGNRERSIPREVGHQRADDLGVLARALEQQALEIGGNLNVH